MPDKSGLPSGSRGVGDLVVNKPLATFGTHPALTGRCGEIVLGKKSEKTSSSRSPV